MPEHSAIITMTQPILFLIQIFLLIRLFFEQFMQTSTAQSDPPKLKVP